MKFAIVALVAALHLCVIISFSSASKTRQKRAWIIDSFSIDEEHPGPFPYKLGKVHVDRDYRVRFQLHGDGVDKDPMGLLRIDEDSGIIYVEKKVDYEKYKVLKLKFEARNVSNSKLDTRLGVEITIRDINDQIPTFQKQVYEVSIDESQKQGTSVLTVIATDDDKSGSLNATVVYDIVSVTPKTSNVEFLIDPNGRISFKGCLNYEKANKYTILVEAKDLGEQVQQSSTCTTIIHVRDKNNHMPVFSGNARDGRVTERESGMPALRIPVTDEDSKGTGAWKVKYTIHGDRNGNFEIQTDPETNDGILTVIKPLDYEEGSLRRLSITAENEEPYFSCELKRKTPGSLWKVNYVDADPRRGGKQVFVSQNFTIHVDDVNDPPEFPFSGKEAVVDEDEAIGQLLETFTAVDPDGKTPDDIVYIKGDDPGGWVSVDPKTGAITTANALDRESPHVVNGSYLITVNAIDKGEPPMTATATLTLHVTDKNDNVPEISINLISMCLSDDNTMTNISAYDLDDPPYAGPFRFELLGEDMKKWSIDPNYGTTVNLIKKNTVYAGQHELQLKIFDQQELFSIQNVSVIVCDCSVRVDCLARAASSSAAIGSGGIGIISAGILALVGLLLLALLLTCGRKKIDFPFTNESGDVLLTSNIEKPGTDCKMPETPRVVKHDVNHTAAAPSAFIQNGIQSAFGQNGTQTAFGQSGAEIAFGQNGALIQSSALSNHQILAANHQQVASQGLNYGESFQSREAEIYQAQQHYSNAAYKTMSLQRSFRRKDRVRASTRSMRYPLPYRDTASFLNKELLSGLVSQRLTSMQTAEEDQSDYEPKAYTCEEDPKIDPDLDCISIVESNFAPDDLLNLGPRFQKLAAICDPKSAKS